MRMNIIYVNGDSFTSGFNLEDEVLYPEFSPISINEWKKYNLDSSIRNEHMNKYVATREKYFAKNKIFEEDKNEIKRALRWSTKLEEKTKIKTINISSIEAADIDAILFRTLTDLNQLKKNGNTIQSVIIQLTSHMRFSAMSTSSDALKASGYGQADQSAIKDYMIYSYPINKFNENYSIHRPKSIHFIDYLTVFFEKMYRLYMFENTVKHEYGIVPIFVDSIFYVNSPLGKPGIFNMLTDIKSFKHTTPQFMLDYIENFAERLELSMTNNYAVDDRIYNPQLHVTSEVHDEFAENIANRYF